MNKTIVTGASGWFGKTFIYEGFNKYGFEFIEKSYFVGSYSRELLIEGINQKIQILSPDEARNINDASNLVQAGFITRDQIKTMGEDNYYEAIKLILEFNKMLYNNNDIQKSALISSGAVYTKDSLYSLLKIREEEIYKEFNPSSIILRVFGATGIFIENKNWSALSSFIAAHKSADNIYIKSSGKIIRSYIDFSDLSKFILYSLYEENICHDMTIDAVSFTTSIHELAEVIADKSNIKVIYPKNFDKNFIQNNYSSNSNEFTSIAKKKGISLMNMHECINRLL